MFATGFWSFLGESHYHGKRDTSKTNCSHFDASHPLSVAPALLMSLGRPLAVLRRDGQHGSRAAVTSNEVSFRRV